MTLYCQPQDVIDLALPSQALASGIRSGQLLPVCQSVTDDFNAAFAARWGYTGVPLLSWDTSITFHAAQMAAYRFMIARGLNPKAPDWAIFKAGFDEATCFVEAVQRQQKHPTVILATGVPGIPLEPTVITSSAINMANGDTARNRGW